MKAITLTQPWATLVAVGEKRIETRSWKTNYRGSLAIHAAKSFPKNARDICLMKPFVQALIEHDYAQAYNHGEPLRLWPEEQPLPFGEIVAICNLIACVQIISKPMRFSSGILAGVIVPPDEPELSFGDYRPGRWAWILDNVQKLSDPIPAQGALGLWNCVLDRAPTRDT